VTASRPIAAIATSTSISRLTTAPSGYLNAKAGIVGPNGKTAPRDVCGAGVDFCASNGDGTFRPFTDSDLYNPQPSNYLYTPSSRYNVYSAGTYKLLPHASTFFEASYLNRTSDQVLAPTPFSSAATISKDSIYNPLKADVLDYQRRLEEFGPRRFLQNVDTFRIVGGVQGQVAEDAPALPNWKWEASYNYGHTSSLNKSQGNLIKSRLAQALGPSMLDPGGKPICVRTPGDAKTAIPGCVPMDILGPAGSIDPAAASWVTFTGVSGGFNQQQSVLAQAHGLQAGGFDAVCGDQVSAHRLRATLRQLFVVFLGADGVGVAFDHHSLVRGQHADAGGDGVELRLGRRQDLGRVECERHRQGKRLRAGRLAGDHRGGGRRGGQPAAGAIVKQAQRAHLDRAGAVQDACHLGGVD
jgi:hypothetical protein